MVTMIVKVEEYPCDAQKFRIEMTDVFLARDDFRQLLDNAKRKQPQITICG
jgi:hypothetical protein